ncbi:MAG: type II secretion system major pseudopilin GspG [Candidatus Aureabacteria bacterium]|nr:type II secretion system major pseudopilin GspG [Candidatus Auribacterota bacterium]
MKIGEKLSRSGGFTLVELMVVIAIIGFLAVVILPQFVKQIGKGQRAAAQVQIRSFEDALEMYYADVHTYPSSEQGLQTLISPGSGGEGGSWNGPYLKKNFIPNDPWKRPYVYISPGAHNPDFDIVSYGKDGVAGGTGDNADIANWEEGEAARGWEVQQAPGYSERRKL